MRDDIVEKAITTMCFENNIIQRVFDDSSVSLTTTKGQAIIIEQCFAVLPSSWCTAIESC